MTGCLLAALAWVAPVQAAPSLESAGPAAAALLDQDERDRDLRMMRRAAERSYRAAADLAMIERTIAEAGRELAALAADPAQTAPRDRAERLLQFALAALPRQTDSLSWVGSAAIHMKYEPLPPGDAETAEAARAMHERTLEADKAGLAASAAAEKVRAAAAAGGERALWLATELAGYAADHVRYSALVAGHTAAVVARLPSA